MSLGLKFEMRVLKFAFGFEFEFGFEFCGLVGRPKWAIKAAKKGPLPIAGNGASTLLYPLETHPKKRSQIQMHSLFGNKTTNKICLPLGVCVPMQATLKGLCCPSAPWHRAWHLAQHLACPPLQKTWPTMCRCAPHMHCGGIKIWIWGPI